MGNNQNLKWTYCGCDCHKYPGTIIHYMDCCRTCLICNKCISDGYDKHLEECELEFNRLNPKPHWTNNSMDDYKFSIFAGIVDQIMERLKELNITIEDIIKTFDPRNREFVKSVLEYRFSPNTLDDLILICKKINLKLSLVAYELHDPKNIKGPINSQMFEDCWEAVGKPTDWFELEETQGKEIKLPQRVLDNKMKRESN